jgi:hypothetical protein
MDVGDYITIRNLRITLEQPRAQGRACVVRSHRFQFIPEVRLPLLTETGIVVSPTKTYCWVLAAKVGGTLPDRIPGCGPIPKASQFPQTQGRTPPCTPEVSNPRSITTSPTRPWRRTPRQTADRRGRARLRAASTILRRRNPRASKYAISRRCRAERRRQPPASGRSHPAGAE